MAKVEEPSTIDSMSKQSVTEAITNGNRYRVVIADDIHENRELLRKTIEPEGYDAFLVPSGELAIKVVRKVNPDLILLDVNMPGIGGFETARQLKADPETGAIPIIFITVEEEIGSLVKAFESGAVDYVVKPFAKEEVLARVRTHVELYRLRKALELEVQRRKQAELERESAREALAEADERLSLLSYEESHRSGIGGLIGKSQAFRQLLEQVRKVRQSDNISVLVTGESGTGKELVARAIHFGSGRSKGPFVPFNCAAIPKDLAESTFFGHVKGAFTGAARAQKGQFELAEGGTLFLDELSELAIEMQAKLLRVLEDGMYLPVGGSQPRRADVRIVAATNRDLHQRIAGGHFREDLYYRLARFTIQVPPLRERTEDIPLLADYFVTMFAKEMGRPKATMSSTALERLIEHDYPGNIRELKNILERAVIECVNGFITEEHLQFSLRRSRPTQPEGAREKVNFALGADENAIVNFVRVNGSITNAQCRELLGTNLDRACYLLNKLYKDGYLQRIGANRGARYVTRA